MPRCLVIHSARTAAAPHLAHGALRGCGQHAEIERFECYYGPSAFDKAHLAHGALRSCGQHAEQEGHFVGEAELGGGVRHVLQQRVAHGGREEEHLRKGMRRMATVLSYLAA